MSQSLSRLPLLLILGLMGLMVGCAGWSQGERASVVQSSAADQLGYRLNWVVNLDLPSNQWLQSVTVLDDVIIAIEQPGNMVTAVNVSDGKVRWRRVVDHPSQTLFRPMRQDDSLYIASGRRLFNLNIRSGEQRGLVDLKYTVTADPALVNDKIFFAAASGRIFTWDLNTELPFREYALSTRITAPLTVVGTDVFAADVNGQYALINPDTLEPVWPVGRTFGAVSTAPALDRLSIFVASQDRSLYALNRRTGEDRWPPYRATVPLTAPPQVFGQLLFLPVPGEGLVAIDATDGEPYWQLPLEVMPAALRNENRLIAFDAANLYLIDVTRGELLQKVAVTEWLHDVLPVGDDSLILVSAGGRMVRLLPGR